MIEQHGSLAEKFLKKGFWLYLFSFIIAPFGYITKIIVSGELEVSEVGIMYGVMSLMVLCASFNDLGMAESLNKFIPQYITEKRYDKVKSVFFYALLTQFVTGGIIFVLFYLGADYLSLHYFKDVRSKEIIQLFAFFFLGTTFFHVITTFFQAIQDTFSQKILDFFRMGFILAFTLYIFLADLGNLFHYSLAWVMGLYFGILIAILVFYKKYYQQYFQNENIIYSKELLHEVFSYAIIVFIGAQAGTILSQIDMQMIIYLLGNTDAGYYTNYLSIIGIPFIIIGPIFGFLFPVFSEMIAKNEHEKITLIKSIFTKNFLSFSIAFSLLFFVFGIEIAKVLFGSKFEMSGIILQYSVLFLSFNFLLQINFNILAANGKIKERLRIILIAIVANTVLNYLFIHFIGVAGAALATGIGWVIIYVLSELELKEYFTHFDFLYLMKNTVAFMIVTLIISFGVLPYFQTMTSRLWEILALCGISLVYFGIYGLLNYQSAKAFINKVKEVRRGG